MDKQHLYQVVVIGASAGGTEALFQILPALPASFPWPIIVVQHLHPQQEGVAVMHYHRSCGLSLKEADDKEFIRPGWVFFAPPNYHLLVDDDRGFSLSVDPRVHYTRPSIDVLFESAVDVYQSALIGIILSGANADGAAGLRAIKQRGGLAVVQDPSTAEMKCMPQSAIDTAKPDYVLPPGEIGSLLVRLSKG